MTSAAPSPPPGGTRAFLQSHAPSLVPSERRVVQVCIDAPELVSGMSVVDLARRAEVSPATVVRACQRMGLDGYQSLRELLIRDQAIQGMSGSGATPQHPLERIFASAAERIHGALGALDVTAFDAAADRIRTCNRLLVVGNGASLAPAQSVALRFLGSGKVCECPVDIVSQHIAAKLLRPDDVCLAVSDSGMNIFTLRSVRLAAENGATVIAVTSYGGSEIARKADHVLVAGADFHSSNDSTITGNIVQMLLLSALHAAALEAAPGAIAARAAMLDEVRTMAAPTS